MQTPGSGRARRGTGTAPRRVQGPRPCYVLFSKALPEDVEIVGSTRRADEALKMLDNGTASDLQDPHGQVIRNRLTIRGGGVLESAPPLSLLVVYSNDQQGCSPHDT